MTKAREKKGLWVPTWGSSWACRHRAEGAKRGYEHQLNPFGASKRVGGGRKGGRRKSRKRRVKGQVLKFWWKEQSLCRGNSVRLKVALPILDLTSSDTPFCPRPPTDRQGLTDYTLRVDAFRTQPSTLHISPLNLEIHALAPCDLTARLPLHKSPFKVLILDLVDPDLHFCDNILITFAFIYWFSYPVKKDWRQLLKF